MAVVINEFEMAPAPPANQSAAPAAQGSAQAKPPGTPSPQEVHKMMRRQQERLARVWAH